MDTETNPDFITISPPLVTGDADTVLFSASCLEKQDDGSTFEVQRTARPMILDTQGIIELWFKLGKFPLLFASHKHTSFKHFVEILNDPHSVLVDLDGIGLALVSDLVPGIEARVQISFWDSKLRGREPFIRELVRWVIDVFQVRRVCAPVRADARAMRAFIERVGLYLEGVLKNWTKLDDKFYDLYLYGVTEQEVDFHWRNGRSWAKPRVRLLKMYETD